MSKSLALTLGSELIMSVEESEALGRLVAASTVDVASEEDCELTAELSVPKDDMDIDEALSELAGFVLLEVISIKAVELIDCEELADSIEEDMKLIDREDVCARLNVGVFVDIVTERELEGTTDEALQLPNPG